MLQKALDHGGPRKEFFVLVLRAIKEKYFDDGLVPSDARDYCLIEKIMSKYVSNMSVYYIP